MIKSSADLTIPFQLIIMIFQGSEFWLIVCPFAGHKNIDETGVIMDNSRLKKESFGDDQIEFLFYLINYIRIKIAIITLFNLINKFSLRTSAAQCDTNSFTIPWILEVILISTTTHVFELFTSSSILIIIVTFCHYLARTRCTRRIIKITECN